MKRIIGISLAVLALGVGSIPAHAAANVVVAGPGATTLSTFATPVVVLHKSAPANFVHLDPAGGAHDVTSTKNRLNGKPWFESDTITVGVAEIKGLDTTPPGEYTFKCSVHPLMRGTATVMA